MEVEFITRPRRDVLILYLLYRRGPLTTPEIHRLLREKYGDNIDITAIRQVLTSLEKYKMVRLVGNVGRSNLYAITERGLKLLRYEGLID